MDNVYLIGQMDSVNLKEMLRLCDFKVYISFLFLITQFQMRTSFNFKFARSCPRRKLLISRIPVDISYNDKIADAIIQGNSNGNNNILVPNNAIETINGILT